MVAGSDGRGGLEGAPFSYREGGGNKVFISWLGRQVAILKGESASSFLRKVESVGSEDAQILMAKVTGNFKRGNER